MTDAIVTTKNEQPIEKISTYMYKEEVIKRFSDMLGEKQAQRFVASVLTAVMADTKLQACTAQSIYLSAVRSATLGLSVDPAYGQAYLVAYGNVCTFMPGYKGFRDKASENGIGCHVVEVYSNEHIEENVETGEIRINGGSGKWRTVSQETGSNGFDVKGYMASWWDVKNPQSGEKHWLYMSIIDIEEYANTYSPSYPLDSNKKNKYGKVINSDSPWNKNKLTRIEMFKKTVLKRLLRKTAPLNPVVSRLLMDFDEDQKQEVDVAFGDIVVKGTEEKPRKSNLELMSEMGFDENPDPVKNATWDAWKLLQARAVQNNVDVVALNRSNTTEADLKAYVNEITAYVVDAERQADS